LDCRPAQYLVVNNDEDPGSSIVSTATFSLPNEALTATFNKTPDEIKKLASSLPSPLAEGREECLRRCRYK